MYLCLNRIKLFGLDTINEQYTIIKNLKDYGHAGIDERSRVRHLIDGIKTKELGMADTLRRHSLVALVFACSIKSLYKVTQALKSLHNVWVAMICVLTGSSSLVLIPSMRWHTRDRSSMPA